MKSRIFIRAMAKASPKARSAVVLAVAYGVGARTIKSDTDVMKGMGKAIESLGIYTVLVFFAAQFVAYFNWTNLGLITAIEGAEPSYWFLRVEFHPQHATCDKETFCRALLAEGLPISPAYWGALPHLMDWFKNRRVFGTSKYPWASPGYKGDRNRQFPTPNAVKTMETQFNLSIHENWREREIEDTVAILEKVDGAFRK